MLFRSRELQRVLVGGTARLPGVARHVVKGPQGVETRAARVRSARDAARAYVSVRGGDERVGVEVCEERGAVWLVELLLTGAESTRDAGVH